jgi:hypothetical protein
MVKYIKVNGESSQNVLGILFSMAEIRTKIFCSKSRGLYRTKAMNYIYVGSAPIQGKVTIGLHIVTFKNKLPSVVQRSVSRNF